MLAHLVFLVAVADACCAESGLVADYMCQLARISNVSSNFSTKQVPNSPMLFADLIVWPVAVDPSNVVFEAK